MKDAGRIGFLIRGNYEEETAYDFLDIVYYAGNSYVAKKETRGNVPVENSENWQIFATGDQGVKDYRNLINKPYINGVELNGDVALDDIGAVAVCGDTASNTTTFISADSNDSAEWTDVALLKSGEKHSSILNKISTMFKNVRHLWKMLGATDISILGDGTVTGALSSLNGKMVFLTEEEYQALGDKVAPETYYFTPEEE